MGDKHTPYSLSDWLGYLSHDEIDELTRLVLLLPDNPTVINIGAGGGTSALTFLTARDDLSLYTIDIAATVNPFGGLANENQILQEWGFANQKRYHAIHGDSKEVGRTWDQGPLDLVFIDGDHSYEGCSGDIVTWLPHLKEAGFISLHDYAKVRAYVSKNPAVELTDELIGKTIKPYPGVDRAVETLLLDRFSLERWVDTLITFVKP